MTKTFSKVFSLAVVLALAVGGLPMQSAQADNSVQSLPFSQDWANTGLITTNDNWSGVPGILGFLGQDITTATGTDPQTLLGVSASATDVDVIANQTNPNITNGGVAEFEITDATIALQGSGTADAPYVLLHFNTTGRTNITVSYNLRDIDASADNSIQPVALQYRVGQSGDFTNLPAGFVADATTGPSLATLVTPVSVQLPVAAENQPEIQVRIITTNAVGNDEWVGIDDIVVTGDSEVAPPVINEFSASTAGTDVEYMEFFGAANTDYSAYTALEIEGDSGTSVGTIDEVINLGTTDANGLYLANLPANALENGSISLLLVKNFTGALNTDLDTDNDGVLDNSPWDAIVDSVAVNDGGAGDVTYGTPSLGVSYDGLPFAPGGASRVPDGADTDTVADWVRNDFDLAGIPGNDGTPIVGEAYNTPGALNQVVLPPPPQLVINEVDYDQPSTDTAEFIEIKNYGSSAVSLDGWTLELVNGTGGGAALYNTITLPAVSLAAGDYFVVCANATTVANCDLDASPDTDFIQNGAPDAVGLRFNGDLMDAVSYEGNTGAPYTEGSGDGLVDTAAGTEGISRCLDGADTNVNNVDFTLAGITPGAANDCTAALPQLTINDVSLAEGDSGTTTFSFTVGLSVAAGAGGVTFDIATADNTAVSPSDFTAKSLTGQTIPEGNSTYTFDVLVNGDPTNEPDETFFVNVINVTGATVADGQGQGTIVNDDAAITFIHDIQGSGNTSNPGTFTVEAIVVGDYQTQGSGQLRGFFLQEEDADVDANPATSEGIFIFCSSCPTPVNVGDKVRVTGASSEFFNMTQLTASTAGSVSVLSSGNPLPTPATVELPVPGVPSGDLTAATTVINAYFEAFEGMLVTFPDTLSISEYFELARYGQVVLTEGGRPHTFTAVNTPSAAGFIDNEINLASRTIILDDTDNRQNRPVDTPNTAYYHPVPGLSTSNFFRGGDTITNLTGVLHWSFAGQTGTDAWRIRPVTEAYSYAFTQVNPRVPMPEVDGRIKVASFNVLNYFLTIDTSNTCAPTQNQDCRGADSAQELERQRTKMLAALSALDADVFGFMEMENTPGVEPLADIVAGLPGYAYVDTGVIGTDAIRVGIIYKTSTVAPVGNYAVLDTQAFVNPRNADVDRNRPAVAQAFEEISTGARFTVVVNHLKSKGSSCGVGDDDTTTGQGNCNLTRTLAAQELANWLATDPTGSGDSDVLIIGDLNSYAKEDPIVALQNAGYTDMVAAFGGPDAYGYVFDGQLGYLDHALANSSLAPQVAGVAEWHINADEIPLFDYNDDERTADEAAFEEESDVLPLYEPNEFRTSDHDPVVIGLNLNAPPTVDAGGPYPVEEGSSVILTATGFDPNGDSLTYAWDLDNNGSFETPGQSVTFVVGSMDGPDTLPVSVKVTDPGGLSAVAGATVEVANTAPTAIFTAPAMVSEGESFVISFSGAFDPSDADTAAGFHYAFDCNGGSLVSADYANSGTDTSFTCTFPFNGTYTVTGKVMDKDDGSSLYAAVIVVKNVTSILDNFNRPSAALGANWRGSVGANVYRIVGNQVDVRGSGPIYWRNYFGINQEASVILTTVDSAGPEQNLLLKVQGGFLPNWGSGAIEVHYNAVTDNVTVETFLPSTLQWYAYSAIPVTFNNGDELGAQALANGDVVIFKNGVEVGRVTLNAADQAFFNTRGGYIGLWFINSTNAFFDDFGGGNVTLP